MSKQMRSIEELVRGFATHVMDLKAPGTKEASVRQAYIDPFWRALGWDVADTMQRGPSDVDVIIENNVETADASGLHNRVVDYLFRVNGFPRFVVEAKKPAVDIDGDKDAIFQAKTYAWHKTIPFAVLTNFEQFRVYDCTLMPVYNEPHRGIVEEFSLTFADYPAQWDVLLAIWGRAAVEGGSLERLLARVKKVKAGRRVRAVDRSFAQIRGSEPVDQVFLNYLNAHRRQFAAHIYGNNKGMFPEADTLHGAARLTESVQRVMDRIVFTRICEDRGIIPYATLREILARAEANRGPLYESLVATFRDMDSKYNGYLFKPHFSEELSVDSAALADFIRNLYPPDGPWNFKEIGDDVLGIVYERFLGNTVGVEGNHATIVEKPEVRHAGGVFYTPRFIVDTIIRRVVAPKVRGRTPAEVLNLKILDPACGSGSFLVAALQYLFDYCLAAVYADPSIAKTMLPTASRDAMSKRKKAEIAFQDGDGRWHLAPDFRAALLTNCIHGVDIDQQAMEVTVMSLYLKMLESKLPENWATLWVERQLLPPLDNNIRCGNSLINPADFDAFEEGKKSTLFPDGVDVAFRINRFDWESRTAGFGRVLDAQAAEVRGHLGFDCIIGNPPYIRVQELNKWAPEECEFYKWKYDSAKKGNFDIYVAFAERCLALLAPGGLLGFIMPHKFWKARYGAGLRKIIADGKRLRSVLDFGDQQVFKGATTYTAVHVLSASADGGDVDFTSFSDLRDGPSQCADVDAGKRIAGAEQFRVRVPGGDGPWIFRNAATLRWLEAVRGKHKTLGEIAGKIAQGIVTSCDDVYFLHDRGGNYFSAATGKIHTLEPAVTHPLLKGSVHMKRWVPLPTDRAVVFPYEQYRGRWRLIPADRFASRHPLAWAYLVENRKRLEERESGKMRGRDDWYAYIYPKNLDVMGARKVLVPAIATGAQYCLDASGEFHFVGSGGGGGGGFGIVTDAVDLHYLCGILNSTCLDTFLKAVTTPFHSGWFAYGKLYLEQIPVKVPATGDERRLAERIASDVRDVIAATRSLRAATLSDGERRRLRTDVEAYEKRIDQAVFELYGVGGPPR